MLKLLLVSFLIFFTQAGFSERDLLDKKNILYDLRPLDEFKKERIKNSIHIDYQYFEPQLLQKKYQDFISFLTISGVDRDKKIIFITNGREDVKKAAFLGFFINLFGIKDVVSVPSFEELKKSRVPTQTTGRKMEPSKLTVDVNLIEKSLFELPSRTLLTRKNTVIFECETQSDLKIKGAKPLKSDDFFQDDHIIPPPYVIKAKNIYLYPENSRETYIVAFLLKNYLKLEGVKILKGDEKQWKRLKLMEKR